MPGACQPTTTQQIAAAVRLFTRTPRGIELTVDGRAFLPHAREVVRVSEVAAGSVRTGSRPFRIDVPGRRVLPVRLVRDFHRLHPELSLDVVQLPDVNTAIAAVEAGTLDVSLRAVPVPPADCPAASPPPEWTNYYEEFATMFGLRISRLDPTHGAEPLLEAIAESDTPATLVGDPGNLLWPVDYDLRCIALARPTPIYPHSPSMTTLRRPTS